jgi:hypothetical protein
LPDFFIVMINMIVPVTILPPSFDVSIAEEDVIPQLDAALLAAHVCVTAARALH